MQNHDNMNTMCDFVVIMTIFVTKQHCRQRFVPAAPWRACKAYGTKKETPHKAMSPSVVGAEGFEPPTLCL